MAGGKGFDVEEWIEPPVRESSREVRYARNMALAAGDRIGHYEILAPIGAGGMGEVFRARDTLLRRTVAIKVLHAGVAHGARGRLLREARAASQLSHPHICSVHSVEEADGYAFIVMEYISGRPLHTLIHSALPAERTRRYGIQIAQALGHAHEHRVKARTS